MLHGDTLLIKGGAGAVLFGHRTAARLSYWCIGKVDGVWWLAGRTTAVEAHQLRQRGLLFSAPRAGGFWCWGVEGQVQITAPGRIRARLGPPEQ